MQFRSAPEVETLATDLIKQYHEHLLGVRIECFFCEKIPKVRGKSVWGYARKITGLAAALASHGSESEDFFTVVIAWPVWQILSESQMRALIDHELCHCGVTPEGTLTIHTHDLEEFHGVVARHGLWTPDLHTFMDHAGQLAMFDNMTPQMFGEGT